MLSALLFSLIWFSAYAGEGSAFSAHPIPPAVIAPANHPSVRLGDEAMKRFDYDEAVRHYRAALETGGANTVAKFRLCDALFFQALERPKEDREPIFEKSIAILRELEKNGVDSAELHARLARTVGQLAVFRGGKDKVRMGREIRVYAEKALARDPDHYLGHLVLGIWHYELASLSFFERMFGNLLYGKIPEGSYGTALEHLQRSQKAAPQLVITHLWIGRTLAKLDRDKEALRILAKGMELPELFSDDQRQKRMIRALIDRIS